MDLNEILLNTDHMDQEQYTYILKCGKAYLNKLTNRKDFTCYLNNADKEETVMLAVTKFINTFNNSLGYKPSTLFYSILFNEYRCANRTATRNATREQLGIEIDSIDKLIDKQIYKNGKKKRL